MSDTVIITEDLINMVVLSADIHVDLLYVRDTCTMCMRVSMLDTMRSFLNTKIRNIHCT